MAKLTTMDLKFLCIAFPVLCGFRGALAAYTSDLPLGWHSFCRRDVDFVAKYTEITFTSFTNNTSKDITQISCIVSSTEDVLRFADFRNWSRLQNNGINIALKVTCDHVFTGAFHLPWPMKAPNLVFLQVRGCFIKDFFAEYFSEEIIAINDSVRVLDLRDSSLSYTVWDLSGMIRNYSRLSADVKCGQLTQEVLVFRNVTYHLEMGAEDWNATAPPLDPYDSGVELWNKVDRLTHKCNYEYLRLFDESYFHNMDAQHFYQLILNNFYPVLEVYNVSNANLLSLPDELKNWRFKFPKMEYLDLSGNHIRSFAFKDMGILAKDFTIGTIDLRNNNISQLKLEDLDVLKTLETATIDLRQNPWSCFCGTNEFLYEYLHQHSNLSAVGLDGYEYLTELVCATPPSLAGQKFYTMSRKQVYCQDESDSSIKILVVFFSVTAIIFGIAIVVFVRYRQELLILAYTRLHIVFPCGKKRTILNMEKTFDAFISYSSKDEDWVLKTFVKRLENFQPATLKLCLHHRDFEIGAAIADNVVKCVESSRHTVIILSKNFIESEWCIYEFRTAMHQSLLERRKHLILVLLEDLVKKDLDADLRKCMETYTYTVVRDKMFWDRILHTLSRGCNNLDHKVENPQNHEAVNDAHDQCEREEQV